MATKGRRIVMRRVPTTDLVLIWEGDNPRQSAIYNRATGEIQWYGLDPEFIPGHALSIAAQLMESESAEVWG